MLPLQPQITSDIKCAVERGKHLPEPKSKIDKLSILGVRSFDNIRSETIQFHTPLTLIVGYNGSGKTTIIECLKYATTGQLPPNSKGGAFIHDPKLCGEKEVLAQVKLAFKATSGAKMVVTRSLQLTVKKATRSQKTLEGSLLMIKDGERTTLSSRVAELDQIMPQYLGVSEAILDSVIFCHQDESLWPMSEPGVLKKKFDEIFEALKYTKAIDNLKALRKNHTVELGKQKLLEDNYKVDKDKADRAERKSVVLQEDIEKLREKSAQLSRDMEAASEGAREKHVRKETYHGILNELQAKKTRAKERQETVDDLRTDLEELNETDEWLEATLAQYQERMETYKQQERDQSMRYKELQREIVECRRSLSAKLAEQGQHRAERENYERQLELRVTLVKEAARRHEIRGFDGEFDDSLVRGFIERVGKLSREKSRELERVQKDTDDELRSINRNLTELEGKRSAHAQDKLSAKQAIAGNDKKIHSVQQDVDAVSIDEGAKAILDASHDNLKTRLKKVTSEYEATDWDSHLKTENAQLRDAEAESDRLGEELVQSTRLADDRAQLDFVKKELKDRQQSLDTMTATHGDKITAIVGPDWTAVRLEREFQAALDSATRVVVDVQRQRDGTNRELEQIEFKLSSTRDLVKKKSAEMRDSEKKVLQSMMDDNGNPMANIRDFPEDLVQLQSDRDTIKSDAENYKHMHNFYNKGLAYAEKQNACVLCERKFAESREKSAVVEKIRKRLALETQQQIEAELKQIEADLSKAKSAQSLYDTYVRLSSVEIPALEKDLQKVEEQRESMLSRVEQQDGRVNHEEASKRDIESLSKAVSSIVRYNKETMDFDAEISRISTQQKSSGNALSSEEIRESLARTTEQARTLKTKINKITSDKDRSRTLVNSLELELRDAANKLSDANHQLEKKQGLLLRIQELRESSDHQRSAIQKADRDIEALLPQIAKAKALHADAQQRGRARVAEMHEDNARLTDTVNKLTRADDEINNYVDKGGPSKLAKCQGEIQSIEADITRCEGEASAITTEANNLKRQVENSEKTKRNIGDNIKFRKNLRGLEDLKTEIAELESRNATEDYDRLHREASRLDMQYQKLMAERGAILGTMKAKDEALQGLVEEWEQDYKHAARNYREAHIRVETTKAAIADLGQYGTALDHAIMKYHSLKMKEINRIAGELWQSTYQGTDVDTIMIRSENENAKGQRNFNYRVCMVKQDAEMDMRGRCSAGQRVLASIIIRLALAECFGVNCGLIALDEPTTNLDQDNIRALAESLHNIIKTRIAQSNFQLIVITHDEEFLRYMKCADFCDNYYRISRDDKQKSVIERQSITEVM